jgi:hypothetical protein
MNTLALTSRNIFGLLELDAAGTVLYSRVDRDGDSDAIAPEVVGSNFFTEVASFENVEEFRQQIKEFTLKDIPADSFTFTCQFGDGEEVLVRVLVARMREQTDGSRTKSTLVHIRKVA